MKSLVIAEKPSVAQDIVRALTPQLGKFEKNKDYYENDSYVVSSAVGHLLEIKAPDEHEVKRGKWSFANLPTLPPYFDLKPIDKTKAKLANLVKLIKRKDIDNIINACDAGREGELIFRLITQYAGGKKGLNKTSQRLWLQSMTNNAIVEGFANLRSEQQLNGLADAARCRAEADWLVGINATRAMTAFNSQEGGFFLTTVGRVQTPTLAIVVEREKQIKNFAAQDYWEVTAEFNLTNDNYLGKWFDPNWKKNPQASEQRASRIWSLQQALDIVKQVTNQTAQVTETTKPQQQNCAPLFDLTSLQREANTRFGFSAKTTLSIAQSLYEKHKALTYPRTDSRYLPEDYLPNVIEVAKSIANSKLSTAIHAKAAIDNKHLKFNKAIFNNSKISDHFAIIPTSQIPKELNELEQKLYDFVVKRFLAVFFPPAKFLLTTRISKVQQQHFKTEGKILIDAGWQAVYGKDNTQTTTDQLPALNNATSAKINSCSHLQLTTKPPARYTESTLLGAMEGAGKLVEDQDLRIAMHEKGIGTPATRAAIIEGLIGEKYLDRQQRDLKPTTKAFQLITLLEGLQISELCQPELTGEWEYQLNQIEKGLSKRADFMQAIRNMTQNIVDKAKQHKSDTVPGNFTSLTSSCPNCGGIVKENYRRFSCIGKLENNGCGFSFTKMPSGHTLSANEAETLVQLKTLGPIDDFRSKAGWPFTASLVIRKNQEQQFQLEYEFLNKADNQTAEIHIVDTTSLGKCLKCSAKVITAENAYICENYKASKPCNFKINKTILQQPIEHDQAIKLLSKKRTDLLEKFISERTKKVFKAYLIWDTKQQRINFKFEQKIKTVKKSG